jgi:hypothetical protein
MFEYITSNEDVCKTVSIGIFIIFFPDEGGEEDSFVGQGPMQSSLFQPTASASDPFAQVGHNPLPSVPVSTSAPLFSRPPASNTPPMPRDGSPNPMRGALCSCQGVKIENKYNIINFKIHYSYI